MNRACGFLAIATLMLSTGFAKEKRPLSPIREVISLTDLSVDVTTRLFASQMDDVAVECKEGTLLPFNLFFKQDLLSFYYGPGMSIRVEKDCYFRVVRKKSYVSYDLQNWERFSNSDLEHDVFGITPQVAISKEGISMNISSSLRHKPEQDED